MGSQKVSAVGLGTWQFGEAGWGWGKELNLEEARRIVHRALELGINFFDTAEGYAGGQSEKILGEALQGQRDDVVVATKVGPPLRPDRVERAAAQSLRRLGMDRIDLYQLHAPDNSVAITQTMEAMRELLEAGQVRQVGVSNFSLTQWKQAEAALGRPVISNQVEYHLLERRHGEYLLPYARQQGRIIIAWSPLAQGLLGGKYGPNNLPFDLRTFFGIFNPENIRRVPAVVQVLGDVGQHYGATPAQAALAWLLREPQVVVIPGARSVAQVEANAAAADLDLSPEDILRIGAVAGT
jgi:aryl-alcohol dehydrogenase-like predicted oxidoreductase